MEDRVVCLGESAPIACNNILMLTIGFVFPVFPESLELNVVPSLVADEVNVTL